MVVGLTGGIGSGKSSVAQMFAKLGVPIYNSDHRAKALYTEIDELKAKIRSKFGEDSYVQGQLNTTFIAKMVFANKANLQWLNETIHPLVAEDFKNWAAAQSYYYVMKEAAILFESGAYKSCRKVVTIEANHEERIRRVMKRDGVSRKEVLVRMSKQLSDDERSKRSDYVIFNSNLQLVKKHVLELHQQLLKISKNE